MKHDIFIRRITAKPLSAYAFASFGTVLGEALDQTPGTLADHPSTQLVGTPINDATGQRLDHPTALDLNQCGGAPCLALFQTAGSAHQSPYRLRAFERHRLGSQTFAPLGAGRCLAVVALGDDEPDLASIEAFVVEPGQVVTLKVAIWHHPLLTLGAATVLVLERHAAQPDCDIRPIAAGLEVMLP